MSLGSVEAEAVYEPEEEVRPRKRPMHRTNAGRPAIARMPCLGPDTDEAGSRCPEMLPRPKRRGQERRHRPKRACADRAIDYGLRGNWDEIE